MAFAIAARAGQTAQAPLLVSVVLALPLTAAWFAQEALTGHDPSTTVATVARALMVLIPIGFVAAIGRARLRRTQASDLVVDLRTAGAQRCATGWPERLATPRLSSSTGSPTGAMSMSPASRRSCPMFLGGP